MAIEVLNGGYIRPTHQITVTRAEFQSSATSADANDKSNERSTSNANKRPRTSHAQVKVAMNVMKQALAWNEDDDLGIARSKALRIVVLEGMFVPSDFNSPTFSDELENDVAEGCAQCGEIEKITVFSRNPRGIVIVKFKTSFAAQECVRIMDGRFFAGKKLRCYFWDGATDYSIVSAKQEEEEEKEEQQRLDEFGDWLENAEDDLPDEFKLQVES